MKTPQDIAGDVFVSVVILILDAYARECRRIAPRAAVILEAAAMKLREEYPDASEEGVDA